MADVSPQATGAAELEARLAAAGPLPPELGKGLKLFEDLAGVEASFNSMGRAMLWTFLIFPALELEMEVAAGLRNMVLGKDAQLKAMHRGLAQRSRALFPLPLPGFAKLSEEARTWGKEEFCSPHFAGASLEEVWTMLSVMALNSLAGYGRASYEGRPNVSQAEGLRTIREGVRRVLTTDHQLSLSSADAEKVSQAVPALPQKAMEGPLKLLPW